MCLYCTHVEGRASRILQGVSLPGRQDWSRDQGFWPRTQRGAAVAGGIYRGVVGLGVGQGHTEIPGAWGYWGGDPGSQQARAWPVQGEVGVGRGATGSRPRSSAGLPSHGPPVCAPALCWGDGDVCPGVLGPQPTPEPRPHGVTRVAVSAGSSAGKAQLARPCSPHVGACTPDHSAQPQLLSEPDSFRYSIANTWKSRDSRLLFPFGTCLSFLAYLIN